MFKHILIPTDGSVMSKKMIRDCIDFAKGIGAEVTGFHVMPPYASYGHEADMIVDTREQFQRECLDAAAEYLGDIQNAADAAGVKCESVHATSDYPYEAIISESEKRHCDLIIMASHGRKGVKGMILGSETQKVLTHSKIPVLVYR